jgi:hypothetical protein
MPPGAPTIHDDIIEAVIEDEIESVVAEARERWERDDEHDSAPLD